tara:strand:- start:1104 stop:1952 length:849 start_codon:yes stop_codon:yes gene_type:complete
MSPFEQAWSVLKADFFLGGKGTPRGVMSADYNAERYKGTRPYGGPSYISGAERYSPLNMHYNTGRGMTSAGMRENFPNMAAAKVVSSPSREPYYRGGSVPRLNPDGSFSGANVQRILDLDFEGDVGDNFDQYAQRVGDIMGHEVVHQLIDPEMVEWAKQQSGIMDLQEDTALKERLKNDMAFRTQMYDELGPYFVEEMLGDYDRQAAEHAFRNLKNMGHETGAFALTPGMTQEEIYNMMQKYSFGPYLSREDPKPMSELHLAGPSADQLRYEKRLQEQGLGV